MSIARAFALAVAVVSLTPLRADANVGKAWAAAKANVPAETSVLVGIDMTAVQQSQLFSMAFPKLLAKQSDLKEGLELIETTCTIDPLTAITGLVVATAKDTDEGAVYVSVKGIDEAKIVRCLEAIAVKQKAKDPKVVVTRDKGGITEMAMGSDKVFIKWIGKDVLVFPIDVDSKDQLHKWAGTRKGLARAPVGKAAGKVDARAAVFAITASEEDLDGVKMKLGYGSVSTLKGQLTAKLNIVVASAADAKKVAEKATTELAGAANGGGMPANLKALVQAVRVTSAGDEVLVRATVPEKELASVLGMLLMAM